MKRSYVKTAINIPAGTSLLADIVGPSLALPLPTPLFSLCVLLQDTYEYVPYQYEERSPWVLFLELRAVVAVLYCSIEHYNFTEMRASCVICLPSLRLLEELFVFKYVHEVFSPCELISNRKKNRCGGCYKEQFTLRNIDNKQQQ